MGTTRCILWVVYTRRNFRSFSLLLYYAADKFMRFYLCRIKRERKYTLSNLSAELLQWILCAFYHTKLNNTNAKKKEKILKASQIGFWWLINNFSELKFPFSFVLLFFFLIKKSHNQFLIWNVANNWLSKYPLGITTSIKINKWQMQFLMSVVFGKKKKMVKTFHAQESMEYIL